jgi:hypothetical protein
MSEEVENEEVENEEVENEEVVAEEVVEIGAYGLPVTDHAYVIRGTTKREAIANFESLEPTVGANIQRDGDRFVLITTQEFEIDDEKILEQLQ